MGTLRVGTPTAGLLLAAIDALDHRDDDPFLTLGGTGPNAFMQVMKRTPRLYMVEYSEGKRQRIYRSGRVHKGTVKRLFLSYLAGDGRFKTLTEWRDVTEKVLG